MGLKLKQQALELTLEQEQIIPAFTTLLDRYDLNTELATCRAKYSAHIHESMQAMHKKEYALSIKHIDIALEAARTLNGIKNLIIEHWQNGGIV